MSAGQGAGGHGGAEEIRRFLDEALRDHVIDESTYLRLRFSLEDREEAQAAVPRAASTAEVWATPMAADRRRAAAEREIPAAPELPPPPTGRRGAPPATASPAWWKEPQPAPEPPAWPAWLARVRELISSDLTLHGLAYLGVLLVFVGVFGFVVFAFGELDRTLRPVAEASLPIACFLGAWFLHRQRAPHVAKGLEMLGGLTLPVVAYASFVDDGTVPQDLVGDALVLALAGVSLAIGVAYAVWSVRHAESVLRYLVAPMAWMAVWALGLWFAEGTIAGIAIREPDQWQMACFTTAVTLTIGLSVAYPAGRFARETRISAIGGLAVGYALILATGFADGWEAGPVALGGAATIVGIELLATGFVDRAAMGARLAQSLVVVFTAAALVPDLDPAWAGAALVAAALALLEGWGRRAGAPEQPLALAEICVGLLMAAREPWPMVAAFGIASVWIHVRRVLGFEALGIPSRNEGPGRVAVPQDAAGAEEPSSSRTGALADLAVVLLPLGVGVGLWRALGMDAGLLVAALVLLASAAAYALVGTDLLASLWLVGSAVIVEAATVGPTLDGDATSTLLAATIVAAGVILVAPPAIVPRIWLGATALAWSGFVGLELAGIDPVIRAEILAAAGLGTVLVGAVLARPGTSGLNVELVGLVAGAIAFGAVVDTPGGARLTCLGAWTLAWVLVVAAGETRGWAHGQLGDSIRGASPPIALALLAILEVDAVRSAGLLEDHPELAGVALSALAVVEAAGARAIGARHRLGAVLAWSAFALGAIGLGFSWPERWSLMVGSGTLIGVVLLLPAALRVAAMTWSAWAASAVLALLVAERAGIPTDQLYAVGFAWSSVVLLGGLALHVRPARAHAIERPSTPWLEPPVTLGAIGLAASLAASLLEPPSVYGWWMLGGAAVTAVATLLLRMPGVSTISWALAAFGAERLARDLVRDEPWIFVAAAAAMLGAAWALSRIPGPEEGPRPRWDLPPFVVAHVVAASGLAVAASNEVYATTWLAAAALSFAVAAAIRRWEWAVAGAVLAAVGAWDLGPGPLAVALGVESIAAGVAASRLEGSARAWLQLVCVALAAAAWTQTVDAVGWAPAEARRATAVASGATVLSAAAAIRFRRLAADWLWPFVALGAAGVIAAEVQLLRSDEPLTGEPTTRLALGASFAMGAVGLGMAASPTRRPELREISAIVAAMAFAETMVGLELPADRVVGILVAASVSSMVVSLALWRTGSMRVWAPAIGLLSALAAVAAPPIAATSLPDRGPLVAALLACGVESAAAGVVLRRMEPLVLAPLLLTGAWITFATEAFAGHPQWFTVPIGIAALAVVEVLRWDHRRRQEPVRTAEIIALEVAGIAFMVGASPIQVIQGSTWAGLVGVVLGILVAAWGALTRVRRRLWLGVVSAVGCLLLMVLVPLTRQLPDVASAEPWLLLGVIGIAVVVIATVLERGRVRLRAAIHHIGELLEGWE